MIVDKDIFFNEVDHILEKANGKTREELKKKLEEAFDISNQLHIFGSDTARTKVHMLVAEIEESLFKNEFSESYAVPKEFMESTIGRVLYSLKYGVAEPVYSTADMTVIVGVTRVAISQALENGRIKGMKKGDSALILVYERDLIKFMKKKKMDDEEIMARLSLYSELKGLKLKKDELKEKFDAELPNRLSK